MDTLEKPITEDEQVDERPTCAEKEDKSNLIRIGIGRLIESAAGKTDPRIKSVIEQWKLIEPGIRFVFDTFESLGIETEAIEKRIVCEREPDILQIIIHLREFTATLLRAIELRIDKGVKILYIHPQKSLSKTALTYAENLRSREDREAAKQQLSGLLEWLGNEQANAEVLMDYLRKCR